MQNRSDRGPARLEMLEQRRLLCGGGVDPALVAYLNSLPADSPYPFDFAEIGHSHDSDGGERKVRMLPPPANVTTVLDNGPSTNRVDIAIVGDGYTAGELGVYADHVQNAVSGFFAQMPLNIYKPYFNVHQVEVISNQSGVDHDPSQGVFRDTALDMGFWCNGIERLLCVNVSDALSYAVNAPDVDQVLAIANATKYGGAGYGGSNLGTFSGGNASALEVALHEFGHSFADLADEYDYGGPVTWPSGEPGAANVSTLTASEMAAQQRKWHQWLNEPNVSAFEGANYSQQGIYRPTLNSKMRSLGRPFEQVNVEQFILTLYETVRPIDSATPAGTYTTEGSFFVDPVDPVGNPLAVQWFLDGVPIAGATGETFDASTLNLNGDHTLGVTVADRTTLVRDEAARATLMTEQRSWLLEDRTAPAVEAVTFNLDRQRMELAYRFAEPIVTLPDPAAMVVTNVTTGETVPASAMGWAWDAATNTASLTFPGFTNGVLPDGNYTATLAAGSVEDAAGNKLASDVPAEFFVLAGDVDRDRDVDFFDFLKLRSNYGTSDRLFSDGDLNFDNDVDFSDFLILRGNYGSQLPSPLGSLFADEGSARDGGGGDGGGDRGGSGRSVLPR